MYLFGFEFSFTNLPWTDAHWCSSTQKHKCINSRPEVNFEAISSRSVWMSPYVGSCSIFNSNQFQEWMAWTGVINAGYFVIKYPFSARMKYYLIQSHTCPLQPLFFDQPSFPPHHSHGWICIHRYNLTIQICCATTQHLSHHNGVYKHTVILKVCN